MEMCDCGHDIYGEHRPFHIARNSEGDRIIVLSSETLPGPIDLDSVFIDEYFFGGAERFINKDLFDVETFVNFCSLCESIVLKDRIILTYDIFASDFANQLRNEGVLANTLWPEDTVNDLLDKTKERAKVVGEGTLNFHILMKLGLSKMMGISYSPPEQESVQTRNLLYKLNQNLFDSILINAYSKLSDSLEKDIQLLKNKGRKIDLFIPPIPAIVLNNISRPEEIPEELLNMRKKFEKTRTRFKEYTETIQKDNFSLGESLKALTRLENQLEETARTYDGKSITTMIHWKDLIEIIPEKLQEMKLEDLGAKEILSKLLDIPIKLILNRLKMRNIVHLSGLKKEFLQLSNYNNLVRKVFGKSFEANQH